MSMHLTFAEGLIDGEGTDGVGDFSIRGTYIKDTGEVVMHKAYIGQHDVLYKGYNESKGIWGIWHIETFSGGFHVWPKGMADPTTPGIEEEAGVPVGESVLAEEAVPRNVFATILGRIWQCTAKARARPIAGCVWGRSSVSELNQP